jgi:hypothetical protein
VATLCVPPLVIWGTILYLFRTRLSADELPFLLIFIALPLTLVRPIYKRYLQGTSPIKLKTSRYHFICAALSAVLGLTSIVLTLLSHRDGRDLAVKLVSGMAWLVIGIDHLRRRRGLEKYLARGLRFHRPKRTREPADVAHKSRLN